MKRRDYLSDACARCGEPALPFYLRTNGFPLCSWCQDLSQKEAAE